MKRLSIITGFLGSGKTTLLNRLLQDPGMQTAAVLINELGSVGIDHLIVDQLDDDIVLLESGCVCCSIRDDLTASLLNLSSRCERKEVPRFDLAILETTGIADPAAIMQLLMSDTAICDRYAFGTVSTVVDACFGPENIDRVPEALRQVLFADRIAVSKTDLVDDDAIAAIRRTLRDHNPDAPVLLAHDVTPQQLFDSKERQEPGIVTSGPQHSRRFGTYQVGWESASEWSAIETWIEGLLSARGDDIWRIKGIMNIRDRTNPVVLQSVQHSVYSPTELASWPDGRARNELTFIVKHFPREAAVASLRPFVALDESDR